MYDLEQLLDELDRVREQLLVAIDPLPDEALLTPGAVNEWSVADLLAILTAWEAELVTGIMRLDQGKQPGRLLRALKDPAAYNAERYAENQGRDLDQIFSDFQHVRREVEDWLERFSERTLTDPRRYKWFRGKSLSDVVAATTFEHEARYVPALQAFAAQWLAQEAEAATPEVIPLTTIAAAEEDDEHE